MCSVGRGWWPVSSNGKKTAYRTNEGTPHESEKLTRFSGMASMVAGVHWEDRHLRVFLLQILWWFPRLGIVAFAIYPPVLQGLDPAITALAVLAIDGVLVACSLWLYSSREWIPSAYVGGTTYADSVIVPSLFAGRM
jgi:hypothetical protein